MKVIHTKGRTNAESLHIIIEPDPGGVSPETWRENVTLIAQALAQALAPESLQQLVLELPRIAGAQQALASPPPATPGDEWRQTVRRKGMLTAVAILGAILVNYTPESRMHTLAKQALEDIQS